MYTLDLLSPGTYKKDTLSEYTGINANSKNAKQRMVSFLEKYGYIVEHNNKHDITILETPTDPEDQLFYYIQRRFGTTSKGLISHLFLLMNSHLYLTSPNLTKVHLLKEHFEIDVTDRMLNYWNKIIFGDKPGQLNIEKSKSFRERTKWFSGFVEGEKFQQRIAEDDERWKKYWGEYRRLLSAGFRYNDIRKRLYEKFGGIYYYHYATTIVGWGYDQELEELLNGVCIYWYNSYPGEDILDWEF